jgi:hypothetical protein
MRLHEGLGNPPGPFWVQPLQMIALAFTLALVTAQVPVQMTSDVSSRTANVGDRFTFVTTAAVTAGSITIPKGTGGYGVVAAVSHAAGTHRGSLELRPQFLTLRDGTKIGVAADAKSPMSQRARSHFFGLPFFIPAGIMVGGVITGGGDVNVKRGTAFTVEISESAPSSQLH